MIRAGSSDAWRAIDGAAEIDVAAELAALLAARHHMDLDLQPLRLVGSGLASGLVLRRDYGRRGSGRRARSRTRSSRAAMKSSIQSSALWPSFRMRKARSAPCSADQLVEARLEAGADLAAIAGAAAPAGVLGVEHQRLAAAARRLEWRRRARYSRSRRSRRRRAPAVRPPADRGAARRPTNRVCPDNRLRKCSPPCRPMMAERRWFRQPHGVLPGAANRISPQQIQSAVSAILQPRDRPPADVAAAEALGPVDRGRPRAIGALARLGDVVAQRA